jgi:RNA 2',3'-cyclic 3'-phosphodiesterase
MTRVFIAVDLDAPTRAALARLLRRLARALPNARVVAPETLHVTLAFLGELDDDQVAAASEAARLTAAEGRPFYLAPGPIGVFGPDHAPRVVWVALGGQVERLRALQWSLARELETRGFALESRPFSPHMTLARLTVRLDERAALGLSKLRAEPPPRKGSWLVDELRVMRSDLAQSAARYAPLAIYPLGSTE